MSEALKTYEQRQHTETAQIDDMNTWLAEALDGQMRSEFTYQFDGQDLIAERDNRSLRKVFEDGVSAAEENARWDPRLGFELRRRKIEMGEYEDMVAMAKGNAPNTMIVVSDFPPELMSATKDTHGYNVTRKQTMLRVISRNEDGSITSTTQSLDSSNRPALEAMYNFMDAPVQSGELLGQRIQQNVDPEFQKSLVHTLTRVYDQKMQSLYGREYFAGRLSHDRRNTMEFAMNQKDLMDVYLAGPRTEAEQIKLAATISARFEGRSIPATESGWGSVLSPVVEMEIQGRIAMREGRVFSGCGMSIGSDRSLESELSQQGYGDDDKKSDDGTMRCVNCPECRTFHHEVRKVNGKPVCDNSDCKLSDKKKSS